jgi:hypothetical protein
MLGRMRQLDYKTKKLSNLQPKFQWKAFQRL